MIKKDHLKKVINEAFNKKKSGVQFRCVGCNKNCMIVSPFDNVKTRMYEFGLFKKALIKNCNKKI